MPGTPDPRRDRALIDGFVARHFRLAGSLRLHRRALGWDLLRAPANVALAPVQLVVRLAAVLLRLAGAGSLARRIGAVQLFLRTDVGRAVETAVLREIVLPRIEEPEFLPGPRQRALVTDYAAVRTAVAEIATTLVVLALGLAFFRAATPGVLTLAPILTDQAAQSRAVADFWLGDGLGRVWYGLFPAALPGWVVVAVGAGLLVAASIVTTFAGILADPVQALLGIHRRRLARLLARIDRADDAGPALAPEAVLARVSDLTDIGMSLVRLFRP